MLRVDRDSPIPLYEQLRHVLHNEIRSGRWTPGSRIPNELELSMQLKVSRNTVRKAILDLVQEGVLARTPGQGTFVTGEKLERDTLVIAALGIDVPLVAPEELFFRLWHSITAAAAKRDLEVVARSTFTDASDWTAFVNRIASEPKTLGVILFTWSKVEWHHIKRLHFTGFPYVLVNRYIPGREVPAITLDDTHCFSHVVHRLHALGHRRILHLTNTHASNSTTQTDRITGYVQAMEELGLAAAVAASGWSESDARRVITPLLSNPLRPTAVITTGGYQALGVVTAAEALGLEVPGDLSVIGVDDITSLGEPGHAITAVDYQVDRISELAVDTICRQAMGDHTARVRYCVVTTLNERGSSGPPPCRMSAQKGDVVS